MTAPRDFSNDIYELDLLAMEVRATWLTANPTSLTDMTQLAHVLAELEAEAYELQKEVANEVKRMREVHDR